MEANTGDAKPPAVTTDAAAIMPRTKDWFMCVH